MRALVLSGGGVKGAYQVGVLKKWMLEDQLDYEILCGVSVGALNVAVLSQVGFGSPAEAFHRLRTTWDRVDNASIRKSWFLGKLAALWKPSVFNSDPLMKWVSKETDVEATKKSGRKVRVGATCWETGEYYAASEQDPDFAKWVYASASFPAFFLPVGIGGKTWTDGGVRHVTPLGEAIRLGATQVDIVLCSSSEKSQPWVAKGKKTLSYALRAIEVQSDEIIRTDLQVCGLKNDLAQLGGKYRQIPFRVVEPKGGLVEDALEFDDRKAIQNMQEQGYKDACALG
jgi:NTE family protein